MPGWPMPPGEPRCLALADAQPTMGRWMRAAGLVCPGSGAGLIRSDLRDVRGRDVACRSGGVMVTVRGIRPGGVPVLARYHALPLAGAAQWLTSTGFSSPPATPTRGTRPRSDGKDRGSGFTFPYTFLRGRAEPLPAVPRDHIEPRCLPRGRRQRGRRAQRRHRAPQHVVLCRLDNRFRG